MITKLEEFMFNELKIILGNPNGEYEEVKNNFLMQCEAYINLFNITKRKYKFENLIKIVQSKMLLDEYEETLDMINKFLKENHSIKYIVYGGVVKSINDGELHSVSPQRLIELYKLGFDFGIYNPIVIKPRSDGNYNLKDLEENYGRYN